MQEPLLPNRITRVERLKALVIQRSPPPHQMRLIVLIILSFESIVLLYISLCTLIGPIDVCDAKPSQIVQALFTYIFVPFYCVKLAAYFRCKTPYSIVMTQIPIFIVYQLACSAWVIICLISWVDYIACRPSIYTFNLGFFLVQNLQSLLMIVMLPYLGFRLWVKVTRDVDEINFKIKRLSKIRTGKATDLSQQCAICIEDYDEQSMVTVLDCRHGFHTGCIRFWLHKQTLCPLCKAEVDLYKLS